MIFRTVISIGIFLLGFGILIKSEDIVKSIVGLSVIQTSLILLFINLSQQTGGGLPFSGEDNLLPVDPLPQALMITAIVIGAAITALSLMLTIKIFHYYGTLNWKKIFSKKRADFLS